MTPPARTMPKPTAQVEPYVDILGAELTVKFLLEFGGAELSLPRDPKGRSAVEALIGRDSTMALAASVHPALQKRVPLARRWLAEMLWWQGHSKSEIARIVRATDDTVRKWLKTG